MTTSNSPRRIPLLQHRDVTGISVDNCTENTRLLRVRVIKATDLRKKDIFCTSDPYCQISLYKSGRSTTAVCPNVQTKTIKRNLNPIWNEEFVFRVNTENRLVFQLFDHNRLTRDDFLGIVTISLSHMDIGTEGDGQGRMPRRFMLHPLSSHSHVKGNLVLYLIYLPTGTDVRTLSVTELHQASRREATQPAGEGVSSSPNTENAAPGRASDSGRPSTTTLVELATVASRRPDGSSSRVETSTDRLRDVEAGSGSQVEPTTAAGVQAAGGRRHSPVADRDGCSSLTGVVVEEDSTSDVVMVESAPLPAGWDERVDQNGRIYYVDHVNKRTQWDRPSCPLPEGWQQRTDPNGRVYYVDHTHHRTTWNHPLSESTDVHPAHSPPLSSRSTADDGSGNLALPASLPVAISGRARSSSPAGGRSASSSRPSAAAVASSSSSTIPRHADADEAAREMFMSRRQVSLEDTVDSSACPQASAVGRLGTLRNHQRLRTNSTNTQGGVGHVAAAAASTSHRPERPRTTSESAVERSNPAVPTIHTGVTSGGVVVVDDDPSETPLPDGWQMALHPDGRKFFINHNDQTTTWVDPRAKQSESTTLLEDASRYEMRKLGPLPAGWEERVHSDGRLFYINHNERTTQWEDPRLAKLSSAALPYSRDYIQKRTYFYAHLRKPKDSQAKLEIQVRRLFVLEDSFRIISPNKKPEILMHRLWIEFLGEKGLDYGGPKREFFFLISKEVFNPYYGLFEYSAADKYTLQINPSSGVANEDHLNYFWFCGCIMAMAIYHNCLIDAFFIRPFYKMMLGRPIHLQDMEPVDDHMYRSLRYLLDEDLSSDTSDFTFSVTEQRFGEIVEVDLIPDGRNIPVTNENKKKFVECYIKWRYTDRVKPQMDALSSGFTRLIDLDSLKVFDANELELLMCGIQDINLADWKNNTLYKGQYHANHPVILGFWKTVYTFTREMQIRLLQFVTGTSRVPMQGFSQLFGSNGPQKFTIECWGEPSQFPRAHTCFNRLDLPPYPTNEMLKCKLIVAIEQSEGFDGVD